MEGLEEDEELQDVVDDSFELISELFEVAVSGFWQNQVFFYLNNVNKLNYVIGEKVHNYCYIQNAV